MNNLVDRILFSVIDNLNQKGSHTNPNQVHHNIEVFLSKLSAEFVDLLPEESIGIDVGAGKGAMSKVLRPRTTYNLDINPPNMGMNP